MNRDHALTLQAFDDPAAVKVLIEASMTEEWAMKAVRWALLYHVLRWQRLMHPADHVNRGRGCETG